MANNDRTPDKNTVNIKPQDKSDKQSAKKSREEQRNARAAVSMANEKLKIDQADLAVQKQISIERSKNLRMLAEEKKKQAELAKSDEERRANQEQALHLISEARKERQKVLQYTEEIADLDEQRMNLSESVNKTWKTAEETQKNILNIEKSRNKELEEAKKTISDTNELKKKEKEINDKYNKQKKEEEEGNQNSTAAFAANLQGIFGSGKGGSRISNILSQAVEAKQTGSGIKGFLGNVTGASNITKSISGIGETLSGMGGALGSIGGVLTKLSGPIGVAVTILKAINSATSAINKKLDPGVKAAVTDATSYLGKMNARLQGSEESFGKIQQYMENNFKLSPIVNQQKLLSNIAQMVDKGIAYNLEERAVLETLSDRMVSTFDTMDSTLLQLTRVQQVDLTSASLGYESLLTQFFNTKFKDTSYLNGLYDQVSAALLDASSELSYKEASALTYAVQKWLGSLYSVGMSENAVTKIAQGINYLATGNVEALNSDEGLRNLFAMATGGSYSGILTGGLDATTVNDLLYNIVTYLQSIAGDTNKVTKQALAGVFGGFSFTDLKSVLNLTNETMTQIHNSLGFSADRLYSTAQQEVLNQLIYASTGQTKGNALTTNARTIAAEQMDNILNNAIYTHGMRVMGDSGKYKTWRALDGLGDNIITNVGKILNDLEGAGDLISAYVNMWTMSSQKLTNTMYDTDFYKDFAKSVKELQAGNLDVQHELLLRRGLLGGEARGAGVSGTSGTTVSGLSLMTRYDIGNNTNTVNAIEDFSTTAVATAQTNAITSSQIAYDVSELYTELFERQSAAMKVAINKIDSDAAISLANIINNNTKSTVTIGSVGESALTSLANTMAVETVKSIDNKLSNGIDVNVNSNFVDAINSGLSYARGI